MESDESPSDDGTGRRPGYSHEDVVRGNQGILPGARVTDADDENGDEMVVLKCMRQTVSEVFIDGVPVANMSGNEDYDDDDTAVVTAYAATLDLHGDRWRTVDRAVLHEYVVELGATTYTYPEGRLSTEIEQ